MNDILLKIKNDSEAILPKLLAASIFSLLLFAVMGQVLCENMGYSKELSGYLTHLLPTAAVGMVAFGMVRFLSSREKYSRILAFVSIPAILWNLFVSLLLMYPYTQKRPDSVVFGGERFVAVAHQTEEVRYMLGKCRIVGHGAEPYFVYDSVPSEKEVSATNDETVITSFLEKDKARQVFGDFRWKTMLPVLSYTYGLWVYLLYALLCILFCIAVLKIVFQLKRGRSLYNSSMLPLLIMTVLPLLGGAGLIPELVPHFFSVNWRVNLMCATPQIGIMLALAFQKKTKQKENRNGETP